MTRRDWLTAFIGAILAMFGRRMTLEECQALFGEGGGLYELTEPLRLSSPFFGVNRALQPFTWRGREYPPMEPVFLMHPREFEKVDHWWRENVG